MKTHNNIKLEPGAGGSGGGGTLLDGKPTNPGGNWLDTLPQELRTVPSLTKFKSPEELARGYVNAESLIGKNRLAAPDASWKDAEWGNFYKALGRPETPAEYKLPADLKLPEGITLSPEKLEKANAALHAAGLTPKQHEAVMRYYADSLSETFTADKTSREVAQTQATESLKQKWGDKFGANLDVAKSVLVKFGTPELLARLNETGFGNDPELIMALSTIGQGMMEDTSRGRGAGGLEVMDSTRALAEIETLKQDKAFMEVWGAANHPGHKAAVARWMELHEKAHPKQKPE